MNIHVDLVKNDWGHGRRILGARIYPGVDDVKIDPQDGDDWNPAIRAHSFQDSETGHLVTATSDPLQYLGQLHEVINNTYWYVTGLHDDDLCPFADGVNVLPIERATDPGVEVVALPE